MDQEIKRVETALATQLAKMEPITSLDRASRRRREKLADKDEKHGRGSVDDRRFFEAHPERSYRIRLATPSEIEAAKIISGRPLPDDAVWFTAVKQLTPGLRMRAQFYAPMPPGPVSAIDEETARSLFEQVEQVEQIAGEWS